MPAFPGFDQAGVAYDIQLWHPEWGPTHISVGIPSYPANVFDDQAVDVLIRQFAADLLPTMNGEKILDITRLETHAETWRPPEPEPEPTP
ncbi:hypothetical protein GCM10010497_46160 [Streptomyces cinereoruber]|uniref:DUF317 domain-containing protein n=1 Tax=Streptomyces cinereoruber TaxID=67260 RepID=A0AAV4KPM5_9ACTN|nr:hypothetical protein [Streptomyces cinereoruber]MBB4160085.1 hypothetical protein [Streptomyces cinereoruber]MBY8818304.1 hypothetical protein [Streptomyces cinereoruber]NIH61023.1 hypothetical protein [Streptomyces cinereoruber]QEV33264.1 hypothetical protein CP977_14730 [Streptomyces cinereoruber]GGR38016.1 hypothetical protein GCM10010497_46160 [Streptomyces cinereoruber]